MILRLDCPVFSSSSRSRSNTRCPAVGSSGWGPLWRSLNPSFNGSPLWSREVVPQPTNPYSCIRVCCVFTCQDPPGPLVYQRHPICSPCSSMPAYEVLGNSFVHAGEMFCAKESSIFGKPKVAGCNGVWSSTTDHESI